MTRDLFEIMTNLPTLANFLRQYQAPEELDKKALAYVRSKFGEVELEDIRALSSDVLRVKRDEQTCAECRGSGKCPLHYHPLVLSAEEWRGRTVYNLRAGKCGSPVAMRERGEALAEDLIKASGLTAKQQTQTFETYVTAGLGSDASVAKGLAIGAAENGEWLVLAGKRGTGKSHLAVAVMLKVMRKGTLALFRSVPEMLDELREGYENHSYYAKMKQLKDVPCLILDDLGKERPTEAGLEYLYQIIDFRYRNEGRQTVITTNAMDQDELAEWSNSSYFIPLLSRLNEMGAWCTIRKSGDYRATLGKTRKLPMDAA
jgi:DNA replication protein DnaC